MEPLAGSRARRGLLRALGAYAMIRLIVFAAALTAPVGGERPNVKAWWTGVPTVRWDAGHYRYILEHGYPPQINDTVAFFPAYPLLCRPVAAIMDVNVAMVVVTFVCGLIAVAVFYRWAERRTDARTAFVAVLLLAAYPPAFFLASGYAEGVFLLCVALAIAALEAQRIWLAALACAVATATRPTGVVLAAVVTGWALFEMTPWRAWFCGRALGPRGGAGEGEGASAAARERDDMLRRGVGVRWLGGLARAAAVGVVSVAGLVAHEAYLWKHYGRADAYFAAQASWGAPEIHDKLKRIVTLKPVLQPAFKPLKYAVRGQFEHFQRPQIWNPVFSVAALAVGIAGLIRPGPIPRGLFLLPVLTFLMAYLPDPYEGTRMVGIARYQLAALPGFLWVARWRVWERRPAVLWVFVALQVALACQFVWHFADWEMVG